MFSIRVPLSHLSYFSTAFLTSTNGNSILPDVIDKNLYHWQPAFHPTLKQPENSVGCTLTISQFQPLPTSTVTSFISAKLTSHQDHCISLPAGFLFLHWPPWCQQPECSSLHLRRITPLLKPFQELLKPLKLKSRCLKWHMRLSRIWLSKTSSNSWSSTLLSFVYCSQTGLPAALQTDLMPLYCSTTCKNIAFRDPHSPFLDHLLQGIPQPSPPQILTSHF